ncbi:uncharacterized protein LOC108099541 [Drosophila ficusphila]|uniref:uncharacterized protein LOC108099541 n=1 Tax=Drosophila ficusphila TaxID=30025 RepID=UPI0007E7D8D9|nr:uncharacterized protein LOC108099541 [Drosophila ficusphila]
MWNISANELKKGKNDLVEIPSGKEKDLIKPERMSSLLNKRIGPPFRRNQQPYMRTIPQNRQVLLQNIRRDREVLGAYLKRLTRQREGTTAPATATAAPNPNPSASQSNSYDLFFESACITVKGLPPKLAAEAKSRISQIITEFEIRAISDMEAKKEGQWQGQSRMKDASGIIYEFRPCS